MMKKIPEFKIIQKFADSYDHLFAVLESKCRRMLAA